MAAGAGSFRLTNAAGISSSTALPPDPPLSGQFTTGSTIAEDVPTAVGTTTDEREAQSDSFYVDDV